MIAYYRCLSISCTRMSIVQSCMNDFSGSPPKAKTCKIGQFGVDKLKHEHKKDEARKVIHVSWTQLSIAQELWTKSTKRCQWWLMIQHSSSQEIGIGFVGVGEEKL